MKRLTSGLACMAVLAMAYGWDTSRAERTTAGETRVADIAGEPDKYLGQTVTVAADVEEVHSARAFSLDEDSPAAGGIDNDLLVLSPQAGSLSAQSLHIRSSSERTRLRKARGVSSRRSSWPDWRHTFTPSPG